MHTVSPHHSPLASLHRPDKGKIVAVEDAVRIAERGTLHSHHVKVPGVLVDCVVVSKPEHHWQTFAEPK